MEDLKTVKEILRELNVEINQKNETILLKWVKSISEEQKRIVSAKLLTNTSEGVKIEDQASEWVNYKLSDHDIMTCETPKV